MKSMTFILFCITLAACLPAAASEPTNEPAQAANSLVGTRWSLQSLNGRELQPGTVITLMFEPDRLWGRAGCNLYGRDESYRPGGEFIQAGVAATEMLCAEPEGVMEQELEYLTAFGKVNRYRVEGDTLWLTHEQEAVSLEYQRLPGFAVNPQDLLGKTWQLVSAPGLTDVDLAAFTLQFEESTYRGTTSCRDLEGTYQTSGDRFTFQSLSMAEDASCTEQEQLAEGTYTDLIGNGNIWQYHVSGTQLELYTTRGETLVFEVAP